MSRHGVLLLAGANLVLAAAVSTRQPWANGPAEWRWEYLAPGALTPATLPAWIGVVLALAGLLVLWCHPKLAARRIAAPLAVVCGAAFTFALVAAQPGGFARVAAALVSRNGFGYVWDAALAPSSRELLADYPRASAGLNQHSVTHPPGPLLAVRALGWLDRMLPAPAAAGAQSAGRPPGLPALAAVAIRREVERARGHDRPVPRPPPGPWTVTALALLLPALSALAAWPLYLLGRRWGYEPRIALLAALLWLLVPARSLFTPSFDQALPLLLIGAAALAAAGGAARAAAAGALLFAACFLSYGCLTALPLVAACGAAPAGVDQAAGLDRSPGRASEARGHWRVVRAALPLALGFALPYLALAVLAGHDPWHSLRAALALHHRIAVAPRSYVTWLLWNPYDFALLLSPAVLGLAAAALMPWRGPREGPTPRRQPLAPWRLACWTWWGLLALLLLSGGVRGEVGRIWLIWMPFACLFAAAATTDSPEAPPDIAPRWPLGLLLATEGALTLALGASMIFVS